MIFTATLMVFMAEMGMVTAGELRKLRGAALRAMGFALLMPVVGGNLGTLLAGGG